MKVQGINQENTVFVILSFEGPDRYSLAGGLGVRVSNLAATLADKGFYTHLFFIGDHHRAGEQTKNEGKLILHRWCQWISQYHPHGVYQGEEEKVIDFTSSIPSFVVDHIVKPVIRDGKIVVVMAEEWHTAEAICEIGDLLHREGLRHKALLLWNANNTFSFDRINWGRLSFVTTITTVSRYMKLVMRHMGIEPLVISNGIPQELTKPVDEAKVETLKKGFNADTTLFKMARWDPAKGWRTALETAAQLKAMGNKIVFPVRGGVESYGGEVLFHAASLGMTVCDVKCTSDNTHDQIKALISAQRADILNLNFFIGPELARIIYASSDSVLANSYHEPFGLVGLESMAAGGVTFVGSTGEDYARHLENAIVLESSRPDEIIANLIYLRQRPEKTHMIRNAARSAAKGFTWENVVQYHLLPKLECIAWEQRTYKTCRQHEERKQLREVVDIENNSEYPWQQSTSESAFSMN